MHLIVDLDDCLVDTSECVPYRRTREGRAWLPDNIHLVDTRLFHPGLREIVNGYARIGSATVLTSSPEDYARAVLRKHGFADLRVIGSAKKPFVDRNNLPQNGGLLFIGDSAKDILTAHRLRCPSIGVSWGYSTADQLRAAQAQAIVNDPETIEDVVREFEQGQRQFVPWRRPAFQTLPEERYSDELPDVQISYLGNYYPVRMGPDQFSRDILNYKDIKDITLAELRGDSRISFFWNGEVIVKGTYKSVLLNFVHRLLDLVCEIPGNSCIVAAPNSNPHFCYKMDVNHIAATLVQMKMNDVVQPETRLVYRRGPKRDSISGGRGEDSQFRTLGLRAEHIDADNIIILDDVTTSGTQIKCIAKLMSHFGYKGPFYGIVLGRTVSDDEYDAPF